MNDENNVEKIDLDKVDWLGSREFFESLGEALDKLDDKDEAYDFTWVGKRKSIIEAGAPINKTLRPNVNASKNWDKTENLFIEGDNLDALKLLQESYLGKVKIIYIDPPYNTGKDFVYHDNFKASVEEYDEATEYKDESGNIQFKKNEKSNGRYHSDWLSMMYPRLKLARNLLTEDGMIFISIDDNEQANLKKLCDEVFGEDNFLATIVDIVKTEGRRYGYFAKTHEYLYVYCKKIDIVELEEIEVEGKSFKYSDDLGGFNLRELRNQNVKAFNSTNRPNLRYPFYVDITDPDGNGLLDVSVDNIYQTRADAISVDGLDSVWRWGKDTAKLKINDLVARKGSDGIFRIYQKVRKLTETPKTVWFEKNILSIRGTQEVDKIMEGKYFDFPKPLGLVSKIIQLCPGNDFTVLDMFSGSATTAHAVIQLNAEDGGNRKWIMVQLPEETDEKSEAYKAGYKTIPEIARERIRRAGDKIAKEHPEAKVDYGFRALTIADTNYKDVYIPAHTITQQELLGTVDNVKEDRTDLDLLYGVLTASALELNRPLETRDVLGCDVFLYDYLGEASGLVACFDDTISEEAIKVIAALKPLTAVFKDSTFPDSQAKVNLSEHFRIISPDTKVKVI